MSEDFISDIRKQHEYDAMITDNLHFPDHHWTHLKAGQKAHDHRGYLLAEVEKLRAWNARLRAQIAEYYREPDTHPAEREE
jgi:hypothetical protein